MLTRIDDLLNRLNAVSKDKYQHFALGVVLGAISLLAPLCFGPPWWMALIASVTVVFAAAWIKEHAIDPKEDIQDILATIAGGAVVWVVMLITAIAV